MNFKQGLVMLPEDHKRIDLVLGRSILDISPSFGTYLRYFRRCFEWLFLCEVKKTFL